MSGAEPADCGRFDCGNVSIGNALQSAYNSPNESKPDCGGLRTSFSSRLRLRMHSVRTRQPV